jgi:hypothetical protein
MTVRLHITNGDSASPGIRAVDPHGEVLPWRDVLHEGPVPAGLDLAELSRVRAAFLSDSELGNLEELERSLAERDDTLRRFSDNDELVLWFEWDLYDQLQLIQVLDFLAQFSPDDLAETGTRISLVSHAGYLGTLQLDAFEPLFAGRVQVDAAMLSCARDAWAAFRSGDPRRIEPCAKATESALEFLPAALMRQLEELPSVRNGLSRSERQILETVAQGPMSFSDIFKRTSEMEDRIYCGDATVGGYIERMSRHEFPLLSHPSGESVDAPRTEEDSRAFRNAEICLTGTGRDVLGGKSDWIALGGSDRWLGGVHLKGRETLWRWDPDRSTVVEAAS